MKFNNVLPNPNDRKLILMATSVIGLALYAVILLGTATQANAVVACSTVVSSTGDSGTGSLREAVACATSGTTVTFDPSLSNQTITLSNEITTTLSDLTIDGSAAPDVRVGGNNSSRILRTTAPNALLTIKNLTLQQGNGNTSGGNGGAVNASRLVLDNTKVLSSTAAQDGGGAYASVSAIITNSTFSNNQCLGSSCRGGGLYAQTVRMMGTHFISNTAVAKGGGAYSNLIATVEGGTYDRNRCTASDCFGGGLRANDALIISGTIFTRNSAGGTGGALRVNYGLLMTNTQLISNTSVAEGAGLFADDVATITNALFQGNACSNSACFGAGLLAGKATVIKTAQFINNSSAGTAGGAHFSSTATLNSTSWQGNTCLAGNCRSGGLFATTGITLLGNTLSDSDFHLHANLINQGNFAPTGGTVTFDAVPQQVIGGAGVTAFKHLHVNNAPGLLLSQDIAVTGKLTLTRDILTTDNYVVKLGAAAVTTGTGDIWGNAYRNHIFAANQVYAFGNPNVSIRFAASGVVPTDIRVTLESGAPYGLASAVTRNYVINADGGNYSATLRLAYRDSEIGGAIPENGLWVWHNPLGDWELYGTSARSLTDNWVEYSGVRNFAYWGVAADTPILDLQVLNDGPTWLGYPTTLSRTIAAGTNVIYNWHLDDGNAGSDSTFLSHTYPALGTYTATLTATNNTSQRVISTSVLIIDAPIMGLSASNTNPTRLTDVTTYTAVITHGTHASYVWNFGDGSPSMSGITTTHIYTSSGRFTATVTAINGSNAMSATTEVSITNLMPIAHAGDDVIVYVTEGITLTSAVSDDPDGHLPLSYLWQQTGGPDIAISDPTSTTISFTAPTMAEVFTFTLIVTDAQGLASSADTVVVNVRDVPVEGLLAENDGPTLLGDATLFEASIISGSNVAYRWDFGDDSSADGITATHTYTQIGSYTAMVVALNHSGSISETTLVIINDVPVDGFSASHSSEGLVDENVAFDATVITGSNVLVYWDFGDGEISGGFAPEHAYAEIGVYTVTTVAMNNANAVTLTHPITISDRAITAVVLLADNSTRLTDLSAFSATMSGGSHVEYTWDYGDGEVIVTDSLTTGHTYTVTGQYTVTLVAANSVSSMTATTQISITNEAPDADIDGPIAVTVQQAITLTGEFSDDPDGHSPLRYEWQQTGGPVVTISDIQSKTLSFITPDKPTVLTFTLYVTDSQGLSGDPAQQVITVTDVPVSALDVAAMTPPSNTSDQYVFNHPITFTASISTGTNVTYTWDFGDGITTTTVVRVNESARAVLDNSLLITTSSTVAHTYSVAGIYAVIVSATNAQGTSSQQLSVKVGSLHIYLPVMTS